MQKHVFFFFFKICLPIKSIINIKQCITFNFATYEIGSKKVCESITGMYWNIFFSKAIEIYYVNLNTGSSIITSSPGYLHCGLTYIKIMFGVDCVMNASTVYSRTKYKISKSKPLHDNRPMGNSLDIQQLRLLSKHDSLVL